MEPHRNASTIVTPSRAEELRNVRRAAWAGLVGTMLEQYDFVIYGTASALIFGRLFFPNISPAAGIMASFGAYAVGFLARPLGGLFFSRLWRSPRTQVGARGHVLLHGRIDARDRPSSHLTARSGSRPVAAGRLPFLPGVWGRRRRSGGATLLTETPRRSSARPMHHSSWSGAALGTPRLARSLDPGATASARTRACPGDGG